MTVLLGIKIFNTTYKIYFVSNEGNGTPITPKFSVILIPSFPINHILVAMSNVPLMGNIMSNSIKDDVTM